MTALLSLLVGAAAVAAVVVHAGELTRAPTASSTHNTKGSGSGSGAQGTPTTASHGAGSTTTAPAGSGTTRTTGQGTTGTGTTGTGTGTTTGQGSSTTPTWRVAWGSAMAWAQPHFTVDQATVRQLATVPIGGSEVRLRISNLFGTAPLQIGHVTVAQSTGGAGIAASTLRNVTFGGAAGAVVPIGGDLTSDPVIFPVSAGETLTASIYVTAPDSVTVHPWGNHGPVSFATANGTPDATAQPAATGFPYWSVWPRLLDAVDVLSTLQSGSIVALGDSITDGFNTTTSWTNVLQQRIDMLPASQRAAVINEGITANTLTPLADDYAKVGGGPAGLRRLQQDVLSLPGVSTVMVLLGTNDLFFGASAKRVIWGFKQLIARAHRAGIKVIGITLLPRDGSERWEPELFPLRQPYLEQINHWILTSHAFDGVANFAPVVADTYNGQCDPTKMFGPYDSGDHLHPNAAGQTAMANSVNTQLLGLPSAPLVAPLVAVQPTPGCKSS